MEVEIICAIDGNQSLKRRKLRDGLEDEPRLFKSSYYISESDVDRFKNDVKSCALRKVITTSLHVTPSCKLYTITNMTRRHLSRQLVSRLGQPVSRKLLSSTAITAARRVLTGGKLPCPTRSSECGLCSGNQVFLYLRADTAASDGSLIWLRVVSCKSCLNILVIRLTHRYLL